MTTLRPDAPCFVPKTDSANEEILLQQSSSKLPSSRRPPPSSHRAHSSRRNRKEYYNGKKRQRRKRRDRKGSQSEKEEPCDGEMKRGGGTATLCPEDVLTDDAFPKLLPTSTMAVPDRTIDSAWSNAEYLRGRLEEEPEHHPPIEDEQLCETGCRLTILRPEKGKTTEEPIPVKGDLNASQKIADCVVAGTLVEVQATRRFDISKLRDRWWDILRHRPEPRSPPPSKEHGTSELTVSYCDESSSTSAEGYVHPTDVVSSEIEPEHPRRLQPTHYSSDQPLHEAIRRDDDTALRDLLKESALGSEHRQRTAESMSVVQLAVHLDRPRLLRILVMSIKRGDLVLYEDNDYLPPLLMAVDYGYEECVQILLTNGAATLLSRDAKWNNVLHYCCKRDATVSTLELVLRSAGKSLLPKLLSSKNDLDQTPLHAACQEGRVDLVEVILSACGISLLSKVLSMQDKTEQTPLLAAIASGSTDLVMSLYMWRGNNYIDLKKSSAPCPLMWAVRSRNIDMVLLLLEFSEPSGAGYDLVLALHEAILISSDDDCKLELVRVLVEAGANPCSIESPSSRSAVTLAVESHDCGTMIALIDTYAQTLNELRNLRRRDPVLQKQPESFFAGMESRENAEKTASLRDALVTSLFYAWNDKEHASFYYACSLALFERDAHLGIAGLERLKLSLTSKSLESMAAVTLSSGQVRDYEYRAQYSHPIPETEGGDQKLWSYAMHGLPCLSMAGEDGISCRWLHMNLPRCRRVPNPDVILVTEDGDRFEAHSSILSQKSAKLGAAIRFVSMSQDSSFGLPTVQACSSSKMCRLLLQHIYHGSIVFGLSEDKMECCEDLLELLLVSERLICPSLLQECEMRLLSCCPKHCFRCYCDGEHKRNSLAYKAYGPSACITIETALDVLAVSQQIAGSGFEFGGKIQVVLDETITSKEEKLVKLEPLTAAREVALNTILLDFESVIRTESFASQLGDGSPISYHEGRRLLLQMCVEELADLPKSLLTIKSRRQ